MVLATAHNIAVTSCLSEIACWCTGQNTLTAVDTGDTCERQSTIAASALSLAHASCILLSVCMQRKLTKGITL